MTRGLKPIPLAERFWSMVAKGPDCWEWQGYIKPNGYGVIGTSSGKVLYAHRVAWELTHISKPAGQSVLHDCDSRSCVRPNHLYLGRAKPGYLDADAASRIRTYHERGSTGRALAWRFGVSESTISRIVNGSRWAPRRPVDVTPQIGLR